MSVKKKTVTEMLQEPLSISDIDFRIQSINKGKYATILAYKDARVDMNRLDKVLGVGGWQKDYKVLEGRLYCGISIKEDGQWIWKWDVGTESNTEAEKGQASDAFKRACFNLGIGRELYSYPVISIKLNDNEVTEYNGKLRQSFNLRLRDWRWHLETDDEGVVRLACKDTAGVKRYDYKRPE